VLDDAEEILALMAKALRADYFVLTARTRAPRSSAPAGSRDRT